MDYFATEVARLIIIEINLGYFIKKGVHLQLYCIIVF